VFCQEDAFPKDIDKLGVVARVFNGVFEVGDIFAVYAENGEKFIPKGVFFTAFVVRADGSILAIGRSFWPLAQPFRWLLTAFSTDCYDLILKKTLEIMANPARRPGWRCADPIKSSVFDVAVAGNPFREGFSCREPGTQGATPAVPDARRDPGSSAPSVRCPG